MIRYHLEKIPSNPTIWSNCFDDYAMLFMRKVLGEYSNRKIVCNARKPRGLQGDTIKFSRGKMSSKKTSSKFFL